MAVTLTGVVLLVGGCTVPGAGEGSEEPTESLGALVDFTDQELEWGDCDSGPSEAECAVYEVPLDYDEPQDERIGIAVKRMPATGDDVIGSLLVNPGGPGGSGFDYVDHAPYIVSDRVRERFDLVGFDPRGVGRSSPITCLSAAELDEFIGAEAESVDGDGDMSELTEAGMARMEESSRGFVEACRTNAPELMLNVGTVNVARDMDVLRALLGDEKLTYLGASYGTHIGAHYADRFPERVRALVLDGAVDPSQDQLDLSVAQATGFETALRAFVEDCLTRGDCPLGGEGDSVADGVAALDAFLTSTAEEPLTNGMDDREINRARAELGVLAALYSESWWERVRQGLDDAMNDGDGTVLLQLGDDLYSRNDPRDYENSTAALIAVNCSDSPSPREVEDYAEAAAEAGEESPIFGPTLAWGALPCAFWPEEAVFSEGPLDGEGAAPIMVVGTTRDSATPYAWAEALAGQLSSGFLVTRDGDGHTGYQMGDACVDRMVDAYLIDLEVPRDGMACA
ncbi:alpha/beta hydrolase [Nocardiopsis lambiniae]|uniref:Alpha/beta hydrolase n=1 Tax=Nocardiopsis lambiniae TaxID=3075539 RepID=A0ABU2M3E4_9ACTN|nr:alpha/beta hydrolase [Nocardiopsis sp. DSM 44743]MDT0327160.1 alpha/beta hydrolase [Nocardiopsis sp. DSM 44743]